MARASDIETQREFYKSLFATPELFVRNFISVDSTPTPKPAPTPPARVQPIAFMQWGAQSDFTGHGFRSAVFKSNYSSSTDDSDPEPLKRRRISYSEEGRKWKDIKIVGQSDEEYIVVREPYKIALNGPNQDSLKPNDIVVDVHGVPVATEAQFIFVGPAGSGTAGVGPSATLGQGQDPESPPPLEELNENEDYTEWNNRHLG